jgi:MinD-like ATPase involved in chromosome partitioning or flagellar assembly
MNRSGTLSNVQAPLSEARVREAEREGIPVVVYEPDCDASVAINELAKVMAGEADLSHVSLKP